MEPIVGVSEVTTKRKRRGVYTTAVSNWMGDRSVNTILMTPWMGRLTVVCMRAATQRKGLACRWQNSSGVNARTAHSQCTHVVGKTLNHINAVCCP